MLIGDIIETFSFLFKYFVEVSKFFSMKTFALVIGGNKYISNYNLLDYNSKFYMEVSYRFDTVNLKGEWAPLWLSW